MADFNIMKVFRQLSSTMKQDYFDDRAPELGNVENKKVNELFADFKALPEAKRIRISGEMSDVYAAASCRSAGAVVRTLTTCFGILIPGDFYDRSITEQILWLLLYGGRELREQLFRLTELENISARLWFVRKMKDIPQKHGYSSEQLENLKNAFGNFIFRHTGYGQKCQIEFLDRSDCGEECFFLYYERPRRITPQWLNGSLRWGIDRNCFEMVLVFNRSRNEIRIRTAIQDKMKKTALCAIWAEILHHSSLVETSAGGHNYNLDPFISKTVFMNDNPVLRNLLASIDIAAIELDMDGSGRQKIQYSSMDLDIYQALELLFSNPAVPKNIVSVRKLRFRLRLAPKTGFSREISVTFTPEHTDLYSKNEVIRKTLETIFQALGIIPDAA